MATLHTVSFSTRLTSMLDRFDIINHYNMKLHTSYLTTIKIYIKITNVRV